MGDAIPGPQAMQKGIRGLLGGRKEPQPPGTRTDHLGQTILDHHDENMSDKEVYPGQHRGRGQPIPHHQTQQQQQQQQQSAIPSIGEVSLQ